MKRIIDYLMNLFKSEQLKDTKFASRKYKLALLIFITTSLLCVLPPCISVFIFKITPLVILSGVEYVTILTTLMGFYFSANVYQKKIITNPSIDNKEEAPQEPIK
jgi:hypothetical protein